ncbi:hypothetical protein K474DRAFT_1664778 [Panus rudis PR-1116 ss-1]|nr:hypothetical protein K474DRAFT_1664778 [Panus rudis PR-1116 ss-1]
MSLDPAGNVCYRSLNVANEAETSVEGECVLPFELVSEVGRHLRQSRPTLKSCNLTCKLWRNAMRPHFFERVVLQREGHFRFLVELIDSDPAIAYWISEVCLQESGSCRDEKDRVRKPLLHLLASLPLGCLKRISSLQIMDWDQFYATPQQEVEFLSSLPSLATYATVTSVSFIRCSLTRSSFKAICCAFQSMTAIHVHGTNLFGMGLFSSLLNTPLLRHPGPAAQQLLIPEQLHPEHPQLLTPTIRDKPFCSPPKLKSHRIIEQIQIHKDNRASYGAGFECVRALVQPQDVRSSLKRLEINTSGGIPAVIRFIMELGPDAALQHLELWTGITVQTCVNLGFSLSHLTNLRTLHLRSYNPDPDQARTICYLLSGVGTRNLQVIKINLSVKVARQMRQEDFGGIEDVLADERFRGLQEFRLLHSGTLSVPKLLRRASMIFPRTYERGILRVLRVQDAWSDCL